jgi:DNA primase large subunit
VFAVETLVGPAGAFRWLISVYVHLQLKVKNLFFPLLPCRTPGDKFNKEYAYNVRYNYGQEGKRQDWSEWSCVKIINQVRQRALGPALGPATIAVAALCVFCCC